MNQIDQYLLAIEYVTGHDQRVVSVGELALIYNVLPELLSLANEGPIFIAEF